MCLDMLVARNFKHGSYGKGPLRTLGCLPREPFLRLLLELLFRLGPLADLLEISPGPAQRAYTTGFLNSKRPKTVGLWNLATFFKMWLRLHIRGSSMKACSPRGRRGPSRKAA